MISTAIIHAQVTVQMVFVFLVVKVHVQVLVLAKHVLQDAQVVQVPAQVVVVVDQDVRRVVLLAAREVVKVPAPVVKDADRDARQLAQVRVQEPVILPVRIPVLPIALITAPVVARVNVQAARIHAQVVVDQDVLGVLRLVRTSAQVVVVPAMIPVLQPVRQIVVLHVTRPARQLAWERSW